MACNIIGALLYLYCRSGCRADVVASALTFHPPQPWYEVCDADEEEEGVLYTLRLAPALQHYPPFEGLTTHMLKTKNGTWVPLLCFRVTGAKFTLVFSHGNATDCGAMYVLYYMLARNCGINVVGYDYTGYGASLEFGTKPTERQTYQDIETVYDWCTGPASALPSGQVYDHTASPQSSPRVPLVTDARTQLIVYGQSLGSGPSCYIAGNTGKNKRPVAGLMLHSPILSGIRVLTPSRALWCFDIFPNIDWIQKVRCRVMVLHGLEDREVGVHHGQQLHAAVPPEWRSEPWWVHDRGHNDLLQGNEGEYFRRVKAFLDDIEQSQALEMTPMPPVFEPMPSPTPGPPTAVKHHSGYIPSPPSSSSSAASSSSSSSSSHEANPTTKESRERDYSPVLMVEPMDRSVLPQPAQNDLQPIKPTRPQQHRQSTSSTVSAATVDSSNDSPQPHRAGLVQRTWSQQGGGASDEEEARDTTATTNAANDVSAESAAELDVGPRGSLDETWSRVQSVKKAAQPRDPVLASASGDENAAVADDSDDQTSRLEMMTMGYAGVGVDTTTLLDVSVKK